MRSSLLLYRRVIWITRVTLCSCTFGAILLQGAICLLKLACGEFVAEYSRGVIISVWVFFLIQALFALISRRPRSFNEKEPDGGSSDTVIDELRRAYR